MGSARKEGADPVGGIGSDDVHVAANEGDDAGRVGARVLDDYVAAALSVGDVGDDEGAAAGGGAEGEEGVEDVAGDAVLLGDQIRGIVLDVAGLADDLGEEGDVGAAIELAQHLLQSKR